MDEQIQLAENREQEAVLYNQVDENGEVPDEVNYASDLQSSLTSQQCFMPDEQQNGGVAAQQQWEDTASSYSQLHTGAYSEPQTPIIYFHHRQVDARAHQQNTIHFQQPTCTTYIQSAAAYAPQAQASMLVQHESDTSSQHHSGAYSQQQQFKMFRPAYQPIMGSHEMSSSSSPRCVPDQQRIFRPLQHSTNLGFAGQQTATTTASLQFSASHQVCRQQDSRKNLEMIPETQKALLTQFLGMPLFLTQQSVINSVENKENRSTTPPWEGLDHNQWKVDHQ